MSAARYGTGAGTLAVLLMGGTIGFAAQPSAPIVVSDAWVRELLPTRTTTAGYMTLENKAATEVALVSARAPRVKVVELHEMRMEEGAMKMRRVERISIPAGGKVTLAPGGLHLMLIGVETALAPGDRISLTLAFSDGTTRTLDAPVRAAAGPPMTPREERR